MRLPRFDSLPDWVRPSHPALRYILAQDLRAHSPATRLLFRLFALVLAGGLLSINLSLFASGEPLLLREPARYAAFSALYFPLVALGWIGGVLAALLASRAIRAEAERSTWDVFRFSGQGAMLVLRARWVAVFYQLRWLLAALLIPRLVFAGLMVTGVAADHGYRVDYYTGGITPGIAPELALLLLAAQMTVSLLSVPVWIGLQAALGLILAAFVRQPLALLSARAGLIVAQCAALIVGLAAGAPVFAVPSYSGSLPALSTAARWVRLLVHAVFGDQSLRLMDLDAQLQVWVDVPYGVFIGAALLILLAAQVVLTEGLIRAALWAGQRPARR